jgi:hypothetical protein
MKFVVFDKNGNILRYGIAPKRDMVAQARTGESVMEVKRLERGMDLTHKVVKGTKGKKFQVVKKDV